jgi:murein L,D-transpeptidase YcbB/YkuD
MTPRVAIRRFALHALLAFATASGVRAEVVDELIRARVEQLRDAGILSVGGESIAAKTLIPKLYEARAFTPTWRSAQQIEGLVEMIGQSWLEGLDPADYHADAVRAARSAFESVDELAPDARADYDLLLTDSVIRLGYHLRFGKVDPVALDSDWNFGRRLVDQDPVETIQAAIDARSMREFAAGVIPRNFLYRRLKTALAEYRGIADRGGWPTVDSGPTLKAGMTDPRVPQLVQRLRVTGDYVAPDAAAGDAKPGRDDAVKAEDTALEAAAPNSAGADSVIAAGIAVAASDAPLAPSTGSPEGGAGAIATGAESAAIAVAAAAAIAPPSPAAAAAEASADPALYAGEVVAAVQRFQARHGLTADGSVGPATLAALNVPVQKRIEQVRANLERARWVMGDLERDFIVVNIAGFRTYVVHDDEVVWSTRSQVGRPYRRTPIFKAKMTYLVLNPTWTVPPTIFRQDILPQLRKDSGYLATRNIDLRDAQQGPVDPTTIDWTAARSFPYSFVQRPGATNALGRIKFMFPNEHFVYLHDTPSRDLFEQTSRAFSSGCIRLENPLDLATLLLGSKWSRERIDEVLAAERTETVFLDKPITVMLLYWTTEVDAQGRVAFWPDVYTRDPRVIEELDAPLRAASVL